MVTNTSASVSMSDLYSQNWQLSTAYTVSASVQALQEMCNRGMLPSRTDLITDAMAIAEQVNQLVPTTDVGEIDAAGLMAFVQETHEFMTRMQEAYNNDAGIFGSNMIMVITLLMNAAKTCLEHQAPTLVPAWKQVMNHLYAEEAGKRAMPEIEHVDWSK